MIPNLNLMSFDEGLIVIQSKKWQETTPKRLVTGVETHKQKFENLDIQILGLDMIHNVKMHTPKDPYRFISLRIDQWRPILTLSVVMMSRCLLVFKRIMHIWGLTMRSFLGYEPQHYVLFGRNICQSYIILWLSSCYTRCALCFGGKC